MSSDFSKELILVRESDGAIYRRNTNGTFSHEDDEMDKPYEYSYGKLMDTGAFKVERL